MINGSCGGRLTRPKGRSAGLALSAHSPLASPADTDYDQDRESRCWLRKSGILALAASRKGARQGQSRGDEVKNKKPKEQKVASSMMRRRRRVNVASPGDSRTTNYNVTATTRGRRQVLTAPEASPARSDKQTYFSRPPLRRTIVGLLIFCTLLLCSFAPTISVHCESSKGANSRQEKLPTISDEIPALQDEGNDQPVLSSRGTGAEEDTGFQLAAIDHERKPVIGELLAFDVAQGKETLTSADDVDGGQGLLVRTRRHREPAAGSRRLVARSPIAQMMQQAPKLVQWAKEAVQYYEGSTLVLSCSLAISLSSANPLKFAWFKQGKPLASSGSSQQSGSQASHNNSPPGQRLSIETMSDYSFLRLADLRSTDSGTYTCVASNAFGQEDRTAAQVIVNVKLKWLAPSEGAGSNSGQSQQQLENSSTSYIGNGHRIETVRAGQSVSFECGAAAQPQPRVRWFKVAPPSGGQSASTSRYRQATGGGSMATATGTTLAALDSLRGAGGGVGELGSRSRSQQQQMLLLPGRLDESQIRSALLQLDSTPNFGDSFQRFEIGLGGSGTGNLNAKDSSSLSSSSSLASSGVVLVAPNETMRWRVETSAGATQHEILSRLILDRAEAHNAGLYECEVTALEPNDQLALLGGGGHHGQHHQQQQQQANNGDKLRRLFGLVVNVPARFAEKFTVVQAKSGESAKLECNATGDQPLTVNWFKEDNKLSKRGGDNFEIYETAVSTGVNSVLVIRTVGRADGLTYKCVGENEYGNDERLIKLMVVEVPSRPMNVRVKDSWSRSASIVWSTPFAGNSPITSYIIQYWRKNNNEAGQTAQNHRRQEFTVSGTQTSALITNLSPALTYEASVIAENQVGRSEPSENIAINTGEDEPASAPSDVSVEARGPTTIKVVWKAPPSETWNGKLLGFYIGFRPRSSNSIDSHQNMQMTGSSQVAFSYRTVDYVKGQQVFEAFLTNLIRGHEYEVIVKAFNSVGSGPDSHLMTVRTFDGDLPASPSLFAHQVTQSSISLRWTYPSRAQSSANSIKRYILYYQRQGDDSWLEIGIPVEEKLRSTGHREDGGASNQPGLSISESGTTSYQLTGLDSGFAYKIYVVAVNNFGMGDPSNIVTTKTDGQINGATDGLRYSASSHSGDFNVFEMNRQFQLFLVVPIVCTIIMVVVIVSAVLYCSRRMQSQPAQHIVTSQPQTMHPGGTWGPEGTMQVGQRYVEFDKGGILKTANGSLLGGTQSSDHTHNSSGHPNNIGPGGHYPLPYGTMPMNSVVISDQKSWDRQSTNAPLKPLVTHIYDSPI